MPSRRPRGAFTLIEAIAAVMLLTVAVPPMLVAVRDAAVRRVDPIQQSRARWLASERLEDVIADRHAPSRGWGYVRDVNYPAEPVIADFPGFSRSTSIVETGSTLSGAGVGYKTVAVSVSWQPPSGAARTLTISTVLTEYP